MIFDFDTYIIDIDVAKTADYHRNVSRITCDCQACRNFDRIANDFPKEFRQLLEKLGVDPAKPQVLSVDYAPSQQTLAYSGFYYLCGTILQGKEAWIQDEPKHYHFDDTCLLQISDHYAVFFSEPRHGVVDVNFPKPVVELQFVCTLPWVLEEPHHYHLQLGEVDHA